MQIIKTKSMNMQQESQMKQTKESALSTLEYFENSLTVQLFNERSNFNSVHSKPLPIPYAPTEGLVYKKIETKPIMYHSSLNTNQKISYFVFITKLKELYEYYNNTHRQRLHAWMYLYIRSSNPGSQITFDKVKAYHKLQKGYYHTIDGILTYSEDNSLIQTQEFQIRLNHFQHFFPQIQSIFQYYSINNQAQNYQEHCEIAKTFFSTLKVNRIKNPEKMRQYEWTRYQYLTYAAFLLIQKDKIFSLVKGDFDQSAEYSFEGNIQKIFITHLSLKIQKSWQKVYFIISKRWKFAYELIEQEKEKLLLFLKQKEQEQEAYILQPSAFQSFLASKKLIDLKTTCQILTDHFQIVSKTFKCFCFGSTKESVQNPKQIKQRKHSIYLIAEFEISQQQKMHLQKLKKQLNQLLIRIQSNNKTLQQEEIRSQLQKIDQILAESIVIDQKKRNYDKHESLHNADDIEIQKESEDEFHKNSIKRFQRERQCQNEIEEKDQRSDTQNNHLGNFSLFYSKAIDFKKVNQIEGEQKRFVEHFPKIQEQWRMEESQSEKSQYNDYDHQDNKYLRDQDEDSPQINSQSVQQLIINIASDEEYQRIKQLFQRKTYEFYLMHQYIRDQNNLSEQNHQPEPTQDKKPYWTFKEHIKFVAFLILHRFAFQKYTPYNTYCVMSEFIQTRSPSKCKSYYNYFAVNQHNIYQLIKFFIQKNNLPLQFIEKQANRQKQRYFNVKGDIFKLISRNGVQKDKNSIVQQQIETLIIQKLNQEHLVFNLKTDYLVSQNKRKQILGQYEEMVQQITLVQKQRYLHCLQICFNNQKRVIKAKLMQFASQIFKQRNIKEQEPLLENYHSILMKRHKSVLKVLSRERKSKDGKAEVKNTKADREKARNQRFLKNFCQRIINLQEGTLQCQIIKEFMEKT